MPYQSAQARAEIAALVEKYYRLSAPQRESITEAGVVNQFIAPFLKALGWPVDDPQRYRYELNTFAGRPDVTLFPEKGDPLFVEAKRFGVIKPLEVARKTISGIVTPGQMALPGMAADRTKEEQQAINYAFENGGAWAILTSFEKLRLFNARRDWLVLSFEDPRAYLEQFELLEQLAYDNLCQGGLEALSHQRYREDVDGDYLNFINEWREKLAQDIVAHPEANPWAFDDGGVRGALRLDDLRAVVQRVLDRLVVVRFAEDHLVIPGGTLYSLYEICTHNPYTCPLSEFFRQLYRRFDEAHNSALFAPGLADRATFTDPVLKGLIEKLYEARYRAMSADIMGNTYEQFLGKTLVRVNGNVQTADNLETRKKQGSYYTPQVIVRYLVDQSLGRYLYGTENGKPDGKPIPGEKRKTAADIVDLRCLDPACGSGSFLIYAYEVLADFYRREITRLTAYIQAELGALSHGLASPMAHLDLQIKLAPVQAEIAYLEDYPRIILETHLYGVDLDPQAAEIATVNLIMRAMADQRGSRKRLPLILNQNIKVGNSLIGAGPADPSYADHAAALSELRRFRLKLATGQHDSDHAADLAHLSALTAQLNAALDVSLDAHFADVDAHHPFNWAVEFPEVFLPPNEGAAGFTIVFGNPPWEIVKPDLREYYAQFDPDIESKLTRAQVEKRIAELEADPKIRAGWEAQKARIEAVAAYYRRAPDYTRQGQGDTATHKLFLERTYGLLQHGGRLGFVVPSGIYTDLGTKDLREMLLNEGHIQYLYSFSNERFFFQGVDHRFKFALLGAQKGTQSEGFWTAFRFNPRVAVAPNELLEFISDKNNLVYIQLKSLEHFSPSSLSVMEFQTQGDYNVTERIYGEHPLMGDTVGATWNIKLNNEFHFTNDRQLLNQEHHGYPFYEGKMIHQFDAYFAKPQFWISEKNIAAQPEDKQAQLNTYRVVHRRIASATNERTLISAIVPPHTACEVNATVILIQDDVDERIKFYVCALLNSFVLDYVIRYKIATTLNMFYLYQLPVPRLTPGNPYFDAIVSRAARLTCTTADFAELWQTVMGEPWNATKAATVPAERQHLRDELDALVAHLYRLTRDDFAHILGTFPLVFPNDDAGERKKAALLAVYDKFVEEPWPLS